jgi:hypothetical protein
MTRKIGARRFDAVPSPPILPKNKDRQVALTNDQKTKDPLETEVM